MNNSKNVFFRDTFWYLLGMIIPMGINVIKTPIFTRHYSAEDYGYLGLVMGIFLYISTVSYSWLSSCIWRFYNSFERKKILNKFYSNLLFLYLISSVVMLLCSLMFIAFYHSPSLVYKLIILSFFHFVLKELLGLFYVILRIKGYAKLNNILLIMQVVFSFIVLLFSAFILDFDITSLISSSIIIDLIFVVGIVIYLIYHKKIQSLNLNLVRMRYLKIFLNFGSFVLISSIITLLLVSSDRYILAMYDNMRNVGIYTKVYDIAQISITAFVFVFFSVINPKMNKELSHNINEADNLLQKYLFGYIFTLLPITFLISIFSKEISEILLGEEFRNGYIIMPYVFFSAFIYGIITINQNKLKFRNKLKTIVQILIICLIINVILNFLVVPTYGYIGAAITTLISYVVMLCLFFYKESIGFFKQKKYIKSIVEQLIVLILMFGIDQIFRRIIDFNIWIAILEGIVFVVLIGLIFRKKYQSLDMPI
ncbi:oligosaccharide flippase family protein [Empedobacter falsenii]